MLIHFKRQKGAVLVITLVILVLITLMSVSELNQAGQQVKMVQSAQQRNLTFQAAENALLHATTFINEQLTADIEIIDGAIVTIPNNSLSTDNIDVSVTYRANIINHLNSGVSLDANENTPQTKQINIVITSTAYIPSSGIKTVLEQGLSYE